MVQASTSASLLSLFEPSPVNAVGTDPFSHTQQTTPPATPTGPWSITSFTDSDIFTHQLTHAQQTALGAADPMRSWELRIGKSGQAYSLSTQGLETQPPQYRTVNSKANPSLNGGRDWAPWADDVTQCVAVNANLNTRQPDPAIGDLIGPWRIHANTSEHAADAATFTHQPADFKYFMHGGGAYLRDGQTSIVHNPMLATSGDTTAKSFATMNWMVQAHSPAIFPGHCISYYRYKDVGGGFIEVTALIYNFRYDAPVFADSRSASSFPGSITSFNFPWGGARETTYGTFHVPDINGNLVEETGRPTFNDDGGKTAYDAFGGWICFSAKANENDRAMAIVTGGDPVVSGYDAVNSGLRWGYVDAVAPVEPTEVTTKRNFQLASFVRLLRLDAGQGAWARWYVGIGNRADLKAAIDANDLATQHATFGLTDFKEATTPLIPWYGNPSGPLTDVAGSSPPRIYTYAWPVSGSVPLFQVKDASGTAALTTDPYRYAGTATDPKYGMRYYKSYDGQTSEWVCLGFVMPTPAATNQNGTALAYAAATSLFTSGYYSAPTGFDVQIRTSVRIQNANDGLWLFGPNSATVAPSLAAQTSTGANTRWHIVPAAVADQFFIENIATGRRLAAASSTAVSQVAAGTTTTEAQWQVTPLTAGNVRIVSVANGNVLSENGSAVELVPLSTPGLLPRWKLVTVV